MIQQLQSYLEVQLREKEVGGENSYEQIARIEHLKLKRLE